LDSEAQEKEGGGESMRNVEPTVLIRAYRSDAKKIAADMKSLNILSPVKLYCADVIRYKLETEKTMRDRIRYLENNDSQLRLKIKKMQKL
jgi:hypothetical protein